MNMYDEPELVRELRRGLRNWRIFCGILAACMGALIWILAMNRPGTVSWVVIGVAALVGGCCVYSLVARLMKPEIAKQPEVIELCSRTGLAFEELAQAIERERDQPLVQSGDLKLLPSWFYQRDVFGVELAPLEDVAWVHKKVTKHSVNFIPTGTSVSLVIHVLKKGKRGHYLHEVELDASEAEVDILFARITEHVPWAIVGWDASLEHNAEEVVARVRRKRAEVEERQLAG